LAAFLPVHYSLWNRFPIWYHLVFLISIIPLVLLGALMGVGRARASSEALTMERTRMGP